MSPPATRHKMTFQKRGKHVDIKCSCGMEQTLLNVDPTSVAVELVILRHEIEVLKKVCGVKVELNFVL